MPQVARFAPSAAEGSALQQRKTKDKQYGFKVDPDFAAQFEDFAARTGRNFTDIITAGIKAQIEGTAVVSLAPDDLQGAPLLDIRVACGAPSEASEAASTFVVSRHIADELNLTDGDFWIRARGESMEGRGIYDEYLVLLSPLKTSRLPRRGEIALVAFAGEDGDCTGTLKAWDGQNPDGTPRLVDGEGAPYEMPRADARPVAIAKGILGSL